MYHHFTLLDGEMVIDTMPDTQKQERRYLVYDMMAINQVSLVEVYMETYFCLMFPTSLDDHYLVNSQIFCFTYLCV